MFTEAKSNFLFSPVSCRLTRGSECPVGAQMGFQVCFMFSVSLSSQMMDESEACSLPGGLASVKRQFENQEFSSTTSQSSVTQFHFEQRSVQVSVQSWIPKSCGSELEVMYIPVCDKSEIGKLHFFIFTNF